MVLLLLINMAVKCCATFRKDHKIWSSGFNAHWSMMLIYNKRFTSKYINKIKVKSCLFKKTKQTNKQGYMYGHYILLSH